MPAQPPRNNPMSVFGPNEWLVDELYQQYLKDKNSVDEAWWEFFADYQPTDSSTGSTVPETPTPTSPSRSRETAAPATTPAPITAPAAATTPASVASLVEQPTPRDVPAVTPTGPVNEGTVTPLRGAAARTVVNMESSLAVPTATSVRTIPAKLLIDNPSREVVAARSASPTSSATRSSRPWP